jgi:NADH dehydrogenase (ubiquinone) 1 alpha subcomplex subunit 9
LPRGTGGRSSFSGRVVTVFGATGTMGRVLCNRLGKEGSQMVVAYRGDEWDARALKLCGDLGQVWFQVSFSFNKIHNPFMTESIIKLNY